MSTTLDYSSYFPVVEPIFVSYYQDETGNSPTLYELKQYLVSLTSDKLVHILKASNSTVINSLSGSDIVTIINLYIRKLRVW